MQDAKAVAAARRPSPIAHALDWVAKPHEPPARDVRLIPIVLFATISLLALKVSGLVFDGGYTFAERMRARYQTDLQILHPRACRISRGSS